MARPTELTRDLIDQIATRIRAGSYAQVAARACGVASSTWYGWLKRGRAGEAPYSELVEAVEKAHAESEVRHVAIIADASKKTWQAAAWWLERHHPERWATDRHLKREQIATTRARLAGTLPPERHDVTTIDVTDPDAVRRRLADLAARALARADAGGAGDGAGAPGGAGDAAPAGDGLAGELHRRRDA